MQSSQFTSTRFNNNMDLCINYQNKSYDFALNNDVSTDYDEVVTRLEKIEKVLKDKFTTSWSNNDVYGISREIYKSRKGLFSSLNDYLKDDSATKVLKRIENLVYPSKFLPLLTKDVIQFIFYQLTCKDLCPIASVNREGKIFFDEQITFRAKVFGYADNRFGPKRYLVDIFKVVHGFCMEILISKHTCIEREMTLRNIVILVKEKFFINFEHKGVPLLHFAIDKYPAMANLFIDNNTINQRDMEGKTPLILASQKSHEIIVKALLDKGADVNLSDNYGNICLHSDGSNRPSIEIMQLLLDKGADINKQNNVGNTPIHHAAISGNLNSIKFLESQGANLNIFNNKDQCALTIIFDHSAFQPCQLNHIKYAEKPI